MSHPVDLYDLLPLGELHVASVRVNDTSTVAPHLKAAWVIVEALGSPPLWATSLHWDAIQGAILANQPRDIAPHAQALVHASTTMPYAATLASAGRAWMQVLAEKFSVDDVILTAHRLRDVGQVWEGRRLVGHAAARAEDRKDTARLLECARELGETPSAGRAPTRDARTVHLATGSVHLSGRERQVARLVLEGQTYRAIGARLYLSERTVEHHMARIRQRFGASGRSELLEQLKSALGGLPDDS